MTVRKQALLSILVTTLLLILALFVFSRLIILKGFSELEEQQVRRNVEKIIKAIEYRGQLLTRTAARAAALKDWGTLTPPNAADPKKSLWSERAADLLGVDALVLVDAKGGVVATAWSDRLAPESKKDGALLRALTSVLRSGSADKSAVQAGVVLAPEGPMIVAVHALGSPAGQYGSVSRIIVGQLFNVDDFERLAEGFPFTLSPLSDEGGADWSTGIKECDGLSQWRPVVVRATGSNSIAACGLVQGFAGKPPILLRMEIPRESYHRGLATVQYFLFSLLGMGLIFAALITFILDKRIVSRLKDLGAGVSAVAAGGDLTRRVTATGSDELSLLAAEINRMLEALESSDSALKQARDDLEKRVEERTWQLLNANERLMGEIDQRKSVEESLRKSEERYRAVVEDQTELICRFLPDWTLSFVNSAYCRYYGRKQEELIGKPFFQLLPALENERTIQHLAGLSPENPVVVSEHQVIAADGNLRWQQWTDRAIFDSSGRLLEFQSVARDVTELKNAARLLRSSLTEKEVLLREIHHRVKNNLQVMASLLNLQSEYVRDEADLGIFKDAESRIWSMALVHETLYQSENLALIKVREYVETLVEELSTSYGHLAGSVAVKVDVEDVSFGIDTAVPLGLIINELVSNAFKHAFPENRVGEIAVRLEAGDTAEFQLTVRDDGVGMRQEEPPDREKSFGLHLVQALVRQLGGELHVNRSEGTQFLIRFKEAEKRGKKG